MVTVTECTTLGKGRLRFHLDNGTELVLYRGEAKQFRMREGSTLSDEEEHQLIYEVVGKRAKRRTMHLLEQMDRTEQQLREKLKQGGYPQACIDLALEYVKSFHYVDDYRYACTYINYRQDRTQVVSKCLPVPIRSRYRALEECYEGDEQDQIIRLLEKKKFDAQNSDQKEFTRVYQYLMRRGFRSNDVLRAMKSKQ